VSRLAVRLTRAELDLLARTRGRRIAAVLVAATAVGAVGVVRFGPTRAGELTLGRLVGEDSLGSRLLPLAFVATVLLSASSAARRRRSLDAPVVLQPGPWLGPVQVGMAHASAWAVSLLSALVVAGVVVVAVVGGRGLGPLGELPSRVALAGTALDVGLVCLVTVVAWLFGWSSRLGPFGAPAACVLVGIGAPSLVVTVTHGSAVTEGADGRFGGALDLVLRGGPAGAAMSRTWPGWMTPEPVWAWSVTLTALTVASVIGIVVDRQLVSSPYDPT
jgi:hypothetical protein